MKAGEKILFVQHDNESRMNGGLNPGVKGTFTGQRNPVGWLLVEWDRDKVQMTHWWVDPASIKTLKPKQLENK